MPVRRSLLFLAQTLPFPPDGGVAIRTFNVLRLLAREFDVTALCFYRRAALPTIAHVRTSLAGLGEHVRAEAFPIPQEYSRLRFMWDHVRSAVTGRAYTVFSYDSAEFRGRLREILTEKQFDLVHIDSLDLSGYLDILGFEIPVVCAHHNVESILLRRRTEAESSLARRNYLSYQARLMEREERMWCPRFALNTAVSREDRESFGQIAPDASFAVVPNGVDVSVFQPGAEEQSTAGLVFVGGYSWFPNRDALVHFCADILPHLRKHSSNIPIFWIGRAPKELQEDYRSHYGVELTGYVDDIRPLVHQAACYVVPLRVGGGTRLKILDAWAMGKAVVSTSVGCEGLEAHDGTNILIRDDPEEFAIAVHQVLEDSELRRRLGRNARHTAENVYDWEVIGKTMIQEYRTLLGDNPSAATMEKIGFDRA